MDTTGRTEAPRRALISRFRRPVAAVLAGSLVVTLAISGTTAEAQTIESLRARATQLSNELEEIEERSNVLNEQFLQTEEDLEELETEQATNQAAVDEAKAELGKTRGEASEFLVKAYVDGGADNPTAIGSSDPNEAVNQKVLLRLLKGDRDAVADKISASQEDLEIRSADLKRSGDALQKKRDEQAKIVDELEESAARHTSLLSSTNSELNAAVAAERQRREAEAAARAEAEQRAAEQAAAQRQATTQATANQNGTTSTSAAPRGNGNAGGAPAASTPAPAPAPAPAPVSSPNSRAAAAIAAAKTRLGTPYRYGGTTPAGFDCSGLMLWAWAQAGVSLPRTSGAQRSATQRISYEQLQPGDLVFSGNPVHHVGMYIGGGQMIHSPRTGDVVKISPVRYMGATSYGRIG